MRTSIIRYAVVGALLLGLASPGLTWAGDAGKGCTLQGTWFGVISPDDTRLTGWMASVTGTSKHKGTNNLEYPNHDPATGGFDPAMGGFFPDAVSLSSMRGNWMRTGGNTFDYTFSGFAVNELGTPQYIARVSGHITLSPDCQYEHITATLEVFLPFMNPFEDLAFHTEELGELWGHRTHVNRL